MKQLLFAIFWITFSANSQAQEAGDAKPDIQDLHFIEGKWKATANDSSFYSILEYYFSPEKRLMMATNHLYGQSGQLFGVYEGAYIQEKNGFIFFLSGPNGETHRGTAEIQNDTLVHRAHIYPDKGTKSYKSEIVLNDDQLFYFANYSKEKAFPEILDYTSPLIYKRMLEKMNNSVH